MKSQIPKWALALVWGLIAVGTITQNALGDGSISLAEGAAILNAFLAAAWAKFSNPEKIASPKATELPK